MLHLDCETAQSATTSVAALLNTAPETLLARLGAFDFDAVDLASRRRYPYEDLLAMHVSGHSPDDLPHPDATYWFHATRVAPGTTFTEGILPLPTMLDRIWAQLGELAKTWSTEEQWARFRKEMRGQGAQQYYAKLAFQPAAGPFAFLVRPIIFESQTAGNHDYLGTPEIIEDICLSYTEMYGLELQPLFVEATRPCIIKFRSVEPWYGTVRAALMFIHHAFRRDDLSTHCNTCFSGEGTAVPHEAIVRIEWPNEGTSVVC